MSSTTASPAETHKGPTEHIEPGSFHSKVVLTATIGGVLILVTTTLFLLFKISRCIRDRKARRRKQFSTSRYKTREWELLEVDGVPA